jgi:hypothetical protein
VVLLLELRDESVSVSVSVSVRTRGKIPELCDVERGIRGDEK